MKQHDLHPNVIDFKNFINKHPALLKEIRKSGRPWQEYYEKWVLLGEDDPYWKMYKNNEEKAENDQQENTESKNKEWMQQLMKYVENVDINKVQENVHQLSNAISSIQELLSQFQNTNYPRDPRSPFTHND